MYRPSDDIYFIQKMLENGAKCPQLNKELNVKQTLIKMLLIASFSSLLVMAIIYII